MQAPADGACRANRRAEFHGQRLGYGAKLQNQRSKAIIQAPRHRWLRARWRSRLQAKERLMWLAILAAAIGLRSAAVTVQNDRILARFGRYPFRQIIEVRPV